MAGTPVGTGQYELSADRTQLSADLAAAKQSVVASGAGTEAVAQSMFGKLTQAAISPKGAIVALGAGMGVVGGEAMKMGQDYAAASNTLVKETGASGDKLKGLQGTMTSIAGSVPEDMDKVAQAVGTISQKLDLTGPALAAASKGMLDYARLTGTDVVTATDNVAAAMERLKIPADQLPGFLDKLTTAEQATGISGDDLTAALQKVGPTLQDMGYSVDGSIALIAAWNKAGGDTAQLATGMNKAFTVFSKEGATNAEQAMQMLVDQIKGAPNDMVASGDAAKVFGAKVGTTMAQQIRNGTLDVGDLTTAIDNSKGSLDKTTEATKTWGERFQEFFNGIAAQVGPFTGQIGEMGMGISGLSKLLTPLGGLLGGIGGLFISGFKGLAAKVIPTATAEAVLIGTAEGETEADTATGASMLQRFLSKFGLMTAGKVAAAAAAGTAAGTAEGEAEAAAMGGTGAVGAAGSAGTAVGGGFLATLTPILAMGAAGVGVLMLPEILDHLTGHDATSIIATAGSTMADHFATGYSEEIKTTYAQKAQDAYNQSLAAAGPFLTQSSYDAAAAAAKAAGDGYLATLPDAMKPAVTAAAATVAGVMPTVLGQVGFTVGQATASGWAHGSDAGVAAHAPEVSQAYADIMNGPIKSHLLAAATTTASAAAQATATAFTQGLYKSDGSVESAFASFQTAMKNPMTVQKQLAELDGELTSKALKKGLASGDPLIRQQALDMQAMINGRIADLKTLLPADGATAVQGLASSIKGGKGAIDSAVTSATSSLFNLDTHTWGYKVGDSWINGFAAAINGGASTIAGAIAKATRATHGQSPPKEGPLREIDKWGENIGKAWHEGLLKGLGGDVSGALGGIEKSVSGSFRMPSAMGGSSSSTSGATAKAGVVEEHIHIHIGTLIANEAGLAELGQRIEKARGLSNRTRLPLGGAFGS